MTPRLRLLDLFCCAGGVSKGMHNAGFQPYGVDRGDWSETTQTWNLGPLRRYPYAYHHGDALDVMRRLLAGQAVDFHHQDGSVEWLRLSDFAVICASPPCQAYSITKHSHNVEHQMLIAPTRELLVASGLPYIIENVYGAKSDLVLPLLLCGSMFNLTATDDDGTPLRLERHRLFESNVALMAPGPCRHDRRVQVAGAYGGGSVDRAHAKDVRRGGYTPATHVRATLLGIDWMTQGQLSQAIPPVYAEHLGLQLLAQLSERTVA